MAYFVYVIGLEGGPVKIGFSRQPWRRLKQLKQTRLCYRIEVAKSARVERQPHRLLKDKAIGGEWFGVSSEKAIATINQAIAECHDELPIGEGPFFDKNQASEYLNVSVGELCNLPLPVIKIDRTVGYARSDLNRFAGTHREFPQPQAA